MKLPEELEALIYKLIPKLEGWCKPEKAVRMATYIIEEQIPVAVEIGIFGGSSLIPIGCAMRYVPGGIVVGIDPWHKEAALEGQNDPANDEWWGKVTTPRKCPSCNRDAPDIEKIHQGFIEAIYANELQGVVVPIRSTSAMAAKIIRPDPIGFLHIDGNHSETASVRDVNEWLPRVAPGGIIVFDDMDWGTTGKALGLVRAQCEDLGPVGTAGFFRKNMELTHIM